MTTPTLRRENRNRPVYRSTGDDGRVWLGVSGEVTLPRHVHEAMGRPRLVRVTPSTDGRLLLEPAAVHGPATYTVRKPRGVGLAGIVHTLGWQAAVNRRHLYRLDGAALTITLDLSA